MLIQSFIFSNFNYCPLVWNFSSAKSLQKIEKIQERALRFLYNDHTSSYYALLVKSGICYMRVSRLRSLCIEIYKTMKDLNPTFMKDLFEFKSSTNPTRSQRNPYDLRHHKPNQGTYGSNSLRTLGPKVWNSLPNEIKSADNFAAFKRLIKEREGIKCGCNVCRHTES